MGNTSVTINQSGQTALKLYEESIKSNEEIIKVIKVSDEQWIAAKEELISQQNALTKQMEKVGTLFAALPENHNSSSETDTE